MYSYGNFSAFFLWSPFGNYEKKSCLNKLKFWEASRNQKRSICWKFQLSISLGTQKSPSTIQAWAKLNKLFCLNVMRYICFLNHQKYYGNAKNFFLNTTNFPFPSKTPVYYFTYLALKKELWLFGQHLVIPAIVKGPARS